MANAWRAAQRLFVARLYPCTPNEINNGVAGRCECARLNSINATNVSNDVTDECSIRIHASRFNDSLYTWQAGVLFINQSRRTFAHIVRNANRFPQRAGAAVEQRDDAHGVHFENLSEGFYDLRANSEREIARSNLHRVHRNVFCEHASTAIQDQTARWRDELFNNAVATRDCSGCPRRVCRTKLNEQ